VKHWPILKFFGMQH